MPTPNQNLNKNYKITRAHVPRGSFVEINNNNRDFREF